MKDEGCRYRARNFEVSGRRERIRRKMKKSPRLSQTFAGRVRRLAKTIPRANEIEVQTAGMGKIVH